MKRSGFNGFFGGAAIAAKESRTIQDISKTTQRAGFVLAAFVATHGAQVALVCKDRSGNL